MQQPRSSFTASGYDLNRLALESIAAGAFQMHLVSDEITYTPQFAKVISGDVQAALTRADVTRHVYAEDNLLRQSAYAAMLSSGQMMYEPRMVWTDGSLHHIRISATCTFDEAGTPVVLTGIVQDITGQATRQNIQQQTEDRFSRLIEQAPVAMCLLRGPDLLMEVANHDMIALLGKGQSIIGKPLVHALPELEGQGFIEMLQGVLASGKAVQGTEVSARLFRNHSLQEGWFNFVFAPLKEEDGNTVGVIITAIEVTAAVTAHRKLEESELFSRSVIDNSPIAKLVFVGPDLVIKTINRNMLVLLGQSDAVIGQPLLSAMPGLAGSALIERLTHVYTTGETYHQPEEKQTVEKAGGSHTGYYNYIYKALYNVATEVYGIMVTATEVTEQVLARQKIEEAEANLRSAIELAELGTWSIDLKAGLLDYSPRLRHWFGIKPNEIVTIDRAYQPVQEADRARVKAAIYQAIEPGANRIYDMEYTVDPLHAGTERILHAQGKAFFNEQGEAYKISGTVQDVTAQRKLELALQNEVAQRTTELQTVNKELAQTIGQLTTSNEELAQYAYVASHDLQEPLRKIRLFSSLLNEEPDLPLKIKPTVDKIEQATERMSLLIRDLLEFSRLLKSDTLMRPVHLNEVVGGITTDFELLIEEKGATVDVGDLPVIEAVALQMNQLFYNLVGNALKFTTPDRPPHIRIRARVLTADEVLRFIPQPAAVPYYCFAVHDNGIGFDSRYADQIFEVFKRLHGREMYPGSGIGLALCRRIAANHHGALYAESEPGKGSVFYVILPQEQSGPKAALADVLTWEI